MTISPSSQLAENQTSVVPSTAQPTKSHEIIQNGIPVQAEAPAPGLPEALSIFRHQHRECWICERIAQNLENGKPIGEDDSWHFITCVLSWEKLFGNPI